MTGAGARRKGWPGSPGLGAADGHHVAAARQDVLGGVVHQGLGVAAAVAGVEGVPGGSAEALRDQASRVAVAPRQHAHHPDRVQVLGEAGGGRVPRGRADRLDDHVGGLGGLLGAGELSAADQDRGARVNHG